MEIDNKPDVALKKYWRNNERFADLFNAVFFEGIQMVNPHNLTELDTDVSNTIFTKESMFSIARSRDVVKKSSDNADFVILGLENQQATHYAMPMRARIYDDFSYLKQCESLSKLHRKNKDLIDADEFLSGIKKDDKFHPVFTIILYYNDKPWDGPIKLSDMMNIPKEWESFFNDYSMVLINVVEDKMLPFHNKENEEFFELIKDVSKLNRKELIEKYKDKKMSKETFLVVGEVTGMKPLVKLAMKTRGEVVMFDNVKKILEDEKRILEDGKMVGIIEGRLEGEKIGKLEGEKIGKVSSLKALMSNTGKTFNEACIMLGISKEMQEDIRKDFY